MDKLRLLLARTNSWSLKRKQLIVLVSVFVIVLILGISLISSLHTMQSAFERTLQGELGLRISLEDLRRGLLELSHEEKDFFKLGDASQRESLGRTYDGLKRQVDQLQAKEGPLGKESLVALAEEFVVYKKTLDEAADLHLKVAPGNERDGHNKKLADLRQDSTQTLARIELRLVEGVQQVDAALAQRQSSLAAFTRVIQIAAALAILFTGLIIGASGHLMLTTTRSLAVISEKIRGTTDKAHATSDHLEKAASTVSQSATDQAAAVAESVATLSEIEAMVAQSVQHARNSADQAKVSHTIATEGQEVMGELRLSMKAIESSMATISDEARSNSERMKSIVQIFDQISQKTTMINDIVFQTKLLSFNASIEAARAGEHGRGFTVVAEEIGNLAQVSGKAAKEIHSLLLDSQRQVNEITQGLRERLDHTVDASFTRIRAGMKISERCDAILEDVVSYTSNVENLMNSIAQAAHEQSDGVRNITAAMSELDRVIHSNSAVAQETLRCSQGMTQVASQLHECTVDLQKDIFGQSMLWTAALDPGQATEPEHDALPDDAAPSENEPLDAEELPRSA